MFDITDILLFVEALQFQLKHECFTQPFFYVMLKQRTFIASHVFGLVVGVIKLIRSIQLIQTVFLLV